MPTPESDAQYLLPWKYPFSEALRVYHLKQYTEPIHSGEPMKDYVLRSYMASYCLIWMFSLGVC